MQTELIPVILLGGLVALDKTEAFQTMLSQPLFIGPAVGFFLSDLEGGFRIGVLLQIAYLWVMPIGTANFPDTSVGAVVSCCAFILLNRNFPHAPDLVLTLVVLFSVPFCLLTGWSLIKQRHLNFWLLPKADIYAEEFDIRGLNRLLFLSLFGSFIRGVLLSVLGIACIHVLLKPLIHVLNFNLDSYCRNLELPIWSLGMGTSVYFFAKKGNLFWVLGGMILGVILLLI
jgi:mannose/fructose/N-acetylgalactosamine-specific phosphotransferase system component IIC